ncbi:MAG: hypothetical protein NVS9B12_09680 [Vulcanimicrobiaceae bacterium]
MTRDCVDPWYFVDIRTNGDVAPCCYRGPAVGNVKVQSLAEIFNGEPVREVRRSLLEGDLDELCGRCNIRAVTRPEHLQKKVADLIERFKIPDDFDAELYLEANPDVAQAGIDAGVHYVRYGKNEGRRLRPA